jgi:hypothetical protein
MITLNTREGLITEMKHYLAGPMTGYENFNIPAFKAAKETLEKKGFKIELPVDIESQKEGWLWGDYLAEDIRIICNDCEGMILLPEWEGSRGAKLELAAALMQSLKFPDFEFYEYYPYLKGPHKLRKRTAKVMAGSWFEQWDVYSKQANV